MLVQLTLLVPSYDDSACPTVHHLILRTQPTCIIAIYKKNNKIITATPPAGKADRNLFADHLSSFDNVIGFDSWKLKMLRRVREDIDEELDLREGERLAHEAELAKAKEDRKAQFVKPYTGS